MNEKKFSITELIIGFFFCLIIDLLAVVADVFSFGILGFFVQFLTWLVFTFYFKIKRAEVVNTLAGKFFVPILVQLIPFIPTLAATFMVRIYIENNPEKFGWVNLADSIDKKISSVSNVTKTLSPSTK
ncbi:MAG: hypothetical protein WCW78_01355 [Candidatus Paceibacterota bacterium]|jgi:hypothetical protein